MCCLTKKRREKDQKEILTVLGSLQKCSDGSQVAFVPQEQGLNFTLHISNKAWSLSTRAGQSQMLCGCVWWPRLGEEVDAVGDGVHGDRVPSDEEAPEVNSGQVVELGVEAGQLPDVIADHVE